MNKPLRGKAMVAGRASGEAVVSTRAFTFAHGVDPVSGRVTDVRSDVRGETLKGKVLIYPHGKGSTTASSWFLETVRLGNNPAAIVTSSVDLSAVIGSVLAKLVYGKSIPVLAGVRFEGNIKTGSRLSVDGATGRVTLLQ